MLDAAGDLPVTFRTLDLGGDKVLPYLEAEREENPALGWRAIRMGLDRPGLLRLQLRALIAAPPPAASCGSCSRMIATVDEFRAARALVDAEMRLGRAPGPPAARVACGVGRHDRGAQPAVAPGRPAAADRLRLASAPTT